MKKFFVGLAVVLFAGSMVSCKKTYTCECDTGGGTTTSQEYTVNKSDAEELESSCESVSWCTWSAS